MMESLVILVQDLSIVLNHANQNIRNLAIALLKIRSNAILTLVIVVLLGLAMTGNLASQGQYNFAIKEIISLAVSLKGLLQNAVLVNVLALALVGRVSHLLVILVLHPHALSLVLSMSLAYRYYQLSLRGCHSATR